MVDDLGQSAVAAEVLAPSWSARLRGEQLCQCGHARRQHVIGSGAGLDRCTVTLPGRRISPYSLFRLVRDHQLSNA
jgi:hypothetical protein